MAGEYREILKKTLNAFNSELNEKIQNKEIMLARRNSIVGNVNIITNVTSNICAALEQDDSTKSQEYLRGLKSGELVVVESFNGRTRKASISMDHYINYFNN